MRPSAYDFKIFYNSFAGRVLRRLIRQNIQKLWADTTGMRIMGYGYPIPYLKPYIELSERCFAVMPKEQGAHSWPNEGEKNLVCLSENAELPIETNSVDRILMIHALEFSDSLKETFEELWRVLKSNGRLLMIIPNRMGLWSRADWSPFGQGTPYSSIQIQHFLKDNLFVHERTKCGLYVPPFKSDLFLRSSFIFEKIGHYTMPGVGGLHFVEASKQLYAGTGKTELLKSLLKKPVIAANPQPIKKTFKDPADC